MLPYHLPTASLTPNHLLRLTKQQVRPPCRRQNLTSKSVPGLKPKQLQPLQLQQLPRRNDIESLTSGRLFTLAILSLSSVA